MLLPSDMDKSMTLMIRGQHLWRLEWTVCCHSFLEVRKWIMITIFNAVLWNNHKSELRLALLKVIPWGRAKGYLSILTERPTLWNQAITVLIWATRCFEMSLINQELFYSSPVMTANVWVSPAKYLEFRSCHQGAEQKNLNRTGV